MEIVSQRFSGWGGISFKFKRIRKAGFCWGGGQKKSQTKMDLEIHKNNSENYRHSFRAAFRLLGIRFRITLFFPTASVSPDTPIAFNMRGVVFLAILEVAFAAFFSHLLHWTSLLHVVI